MPTLTTLYSVRDSLGQELWWSTKRLSTIQLCAELNAIGEGATIALRAGRPYAVRNERPEDDATPGVLHRDTLPVAVFKVTKVNLATVVRSRKVPQSALEPYP